MNLLAETQTASFLPVGGQRLLGEEIGRRFVGAAVAGFWDEIPGLQGAQRSFCHEAPNSGRATSDAPIGEFLGEPTVGVTSAVVTEEGFDLRSDLGIGQLGGSRLGCVIEAAAWPSQRRADLAHTAAGFLGQVGDHRSSLPMRSTQSAAPTIFDFVITSSIT